MTVAAIGAAVALGLGAGYAGGRSHAPSDLLSVDRDVEGVVLNISSDHDAITLATDDGELALRLLDGDSLAQGQKVTGTVLDVRLDGASEAVFLPHVSGP